MCQSTFTDRLYALYRPGIMFEELERLMYPDDKHPRYWNRSMNGGPPGGRRALVKGLRKHGVTIIDKNGGKACHGQITIRV